MAKIQKSERRPRMKIIPDIKATFGETYFLGFTEKKKFDQTANRKTDELESYVCRISSSELQGQIEVTVPVSVAIQEIKFNQKVFLQGVIIDPYAKSSEGTSFAQIILRCTAKEILSESASVSELPRKEGQKQS